MALPNTLDGWLSYQERLHAQPIELGLERVRAVAARMGLPRRGIRSIIVGGTNGKGSTANLLAGIYRAAGYRVGLYTSPHLYAYPERIVIDSRPVADADLCSAFAEVERARAEISLTYFEFGTLAALWLFAEARLDVQVLEVGLGGRLDAVNIVDADAAIVTNIGLDHQDYLGDTRDAIGREKAGIFRAKAPAIIASPMPCEGLVTAASATGARLIRRELGDFDVRQHGDRWEWFDAHTRLLDLPLPALAGAHQLENAAGALAVVQQLQALLPASTEAIAEALRGLTLPGRMQWRGRVLLDVGHNAEAAAAVARSLECLLAPGEKLIWVLAMLRDKPAAAMAAALAPHVSEVHVFGLPAPRGFSADELQACVASAGLPVHSHPSASAAWLAARSAAGENQRILVSGSFHTVAAIAPLLPLDPETP